MNDVLSNLRRLSLGLALIAAAATVLLLSDPRRRTSERRTILKVALVNFVSAPVLEDGQRGTIDALADEGFADGREIVLSRFNAEGDIATANLIAKEVVGKDYDLILTLSTPVLQAVGNANTSTRRTHVFTLSTDPWSAGVGLDPKDRDKHPEWMTGYGTMQPVEKVFRMAREANPKLARVGVVWNPSESNSEASTRLGREVCKTLGIELVEVPIDSAAAVSEAAKALVTRGVDALWVGGDATVTSAFDGVVDAARRGKIPVFTNFPGDVKRGSLFSVGADYYQVGRASGVLAARVLRGERPANIPVTNYVPEQIAINTVNLEGLDPAWRLPGEWNRTAHIVVDEKGTREKEAPKRPEPVRGRTYRVSLLYFAPDSVSASVIEGIKRRLAERGFIEGKNLEFRAEHAQGEIALIPALLQKMDQSDADLIVTLTTPCLTAASNVVKTKPVVFTEVYDPIAAGAGTTAKDHLPHVTGVGSFPPLDRMFDAMLQLVPKLKSVGVVYNSSEANSRKVISVAKELAAKRQIRLELATVTNSSEVLQAAQVLAQRQVDLLWEIGDNTVFEGLEGLVKAGQQAHLPVMGSDAAGIERGAAATVGIRFSDSGVAGGEVAARVLLGEKPAEIPFEEVAVVEHAANWKAAAEAGLTLPVEFLAECAEIRGLRSRLGRPLQVALVQLVESPALDAASDGVRKGMEESGLVAGEDVVLRMHNAQGDLSQLPLIFATIIDAKADLIVTNTTPAMIAAARATKEIPIVFTVASNPADVGVHPKAERPANLAGVYDDPPVDRLIALAEQREGTLKMVGTIWNPAEPNSRISVEKLRAVCKERGLTLIEQNAATVTELPDATAAACLKGAQILVVSADNVASAGLPAILKVTQKERVPVYCTEPDMVRKGATAAIGDDYYEWGRQSARMAVRVLAGVPPARLGYEKTAVQRTVTADDVALQRRIDGEKSSRRKD